jgi:hypothetical protein
MLNAFRFHLRRLFVLIAKAHFSVNFENPNINQVGGFMLICNLHLPCMTFVDAIAILVVYSMSEDGPARTTPEPGAKGGSTKHGFLAGSKALDSFATFMMSKELLFHPSQSSSVTRSVCGPLHSTKSPLNPESSSLR